MSVRKKLFWSLFSLLLAALSIWAVLSQSRKWSLENVLESLKNALITMGVMVVMFFVLNGIALLRVKKRAGK